MEGEIDIIWSKRSANQTCTSEYSHLLSMCYGFPIECAQYYSKLMANFSEVVVLKEGWGKGRDWQSGQVYIYQLKKGVWVSNFYKIFLWLYSVSYGETFGLNHPYGVNL